MCLFVLCVFYGGMWCFCVCELCLCLCVMFVCAIFVFVLYDVCVWIFLVCV